MPFAGSHLTFPTPSYRIETRLVINYTQWPELGRSRSQRESSVGPQDRSCCARQHVFGGQDIDRPGAIQRSKGRRGRRIRRWRRRRWRWSHLCARACCGQLEERRTDSERVRTMARAGQMIMIGGTCIIRDAL